MRSSSNRSRSLRPNLECLEDRANPATFTVQNLGDTGPGSLRAAVDLANITPGADTIVFAPAIQGGTVNLTTFTSQPNSSVPNPQPIGPTALIVLDDVTIQGTGETITRTAADAFRLFQVAPRVGLTLNNLTLSNGLAQGGSGGQGGAGAAGLGGAVYNQGILSINNSTLVGNQAVGGIGLAIFGGSGQGGGGLNGGLAGVNGGGPNGGAPGANGGFGGGGGGGAVGLGATGGNGGFGAGGGGGRGGFGGGNGGFGGGGGGGGGFGGGAGGLSVFGGGAGGANGGAGGGGAGIGGAVFNQAGTVTITNSTITGNSATGGGAGQGAQVGGGFGGGVFNLNGALTLTNVTVAGNTVAAGLVQPGGVAGTADGGAVYSLATNAIATPTMTATFTVANSILANSTGGSDVVNNRAFGTATLTATGPNIVSTAVVNPLGMGTITGTPFTVTDPKLGPLQNNGGRTLTFAPLAGSPALNAGSNTAAAGLTTDQRGTGFDRIKNGIVDIGAVENQTTPPGGGGNPTTARPLVVSGQTNGSANVFQPGAGGQFSATPKATVNPFGNTGANARVAVGDVNGDGTPDTILVTGPGVPLRAAVVSGVDNTTVLVQPFDPFGGDFLGGGYVAAADLNGDGRAEFVITPDQGGGPRVSVFSVNPDGSRTTRSNFLGIDDQNFRGGARAALGDVNKDGTPDVIISAGFGGGPRTAIFTGQSVLAGSPTRMVSDFFAFPGSDATNLRNGSFVAAGDVTGDGFADLVFGGGPGGAARVFVLSGALVSAGNVAGAQATPVANFFVGGDLNDRGGARVGVTNADGDGKMDLVVGSGAGRAAKARVYLGTNVTGAGEPTAFQDLTLFGGAVLTDGVFVG